MFDRQKTSMSLSSNVGDKHFASTAMLAHPAHVIHQYIQL